MTSGGLSFLLSYQKARAMLGSPCHVHVHWPCGDNGHALAPHPQAIALLKRADCTICVLGLGRSGTALPAVRRPCSFEADEIGADLPEECSVNA